MRIVYVCRVFSGFEESLATGRWSPTGAPTIFKVMEAVANSDHETLFVMTARGIGREFSGSWGETSDREVILEGFPSPLLVLAGESRLTRWCGRFRAHLTEIIRLFRIWQEVRRFRPDLIYVDRSNVLPGALFARFTRYRVLLRVMGVYPSMRDLLSSRKISDRIQRWSFRSSFAHVLCTQDGSGGEFWMKDAIRKSVPTTTLLNGVTREAPDVSLPVPELDNIPSDCLVVMYVGRLESYKGCREFVTTCLGFKDDLEHRIHAVVIGTGSLESELRESVRKTHADKMFTFVPRISHELVPSALSKADIYVSLNHLGNLSNANLECMAQGLCMVFPHSKPNEGIDIITDRLVPESAVIRLPAENSEEHLAAHIRRIASNPNIAKEYGLAMKNVASDFIPSWDERIDAEVQLLEQIVAEDRADG